MSIEEATQNVPQNQTQEEGAQAGTDTFTWIYGSFKVVPKGGNKYFITINDIQHTTLERINKVDTD